MWQTARDLWTILSSKQRFKCALLIIALGLIGILEAVGIGAVWPLINFLSDPGYLRKFPLVLRIFSGLGAVTFFSQIAIICLALLAFYFIKGFLVVYVNQKEYGFSMDSQGVYGSWLLSYYLRQPYLFHVNSHSSTLISNMSGGMREIFLQLIPEYFHLGAELLTAGMIWLLLVYVDWFTAIVVAGFFAGLLYLLLRAIRRKSIAAGQMWQQYAKESTQWLRQSLAGIKETKLGHKEDFFVQAYGTAYAKTTEGEKIRMVLNTMPRTVIEVVVVAALILLILVKLWLGQTAEQIVPMLGVLALAAFRLMPCANRCMISFNAIRYSQPIFYELYPDLLAARKQAMSSLKAAKIKPLPFQREIRLQNLAFGYEPKKILWQKVNLTIRKGDFVGVIGASGVGKTTFIDVFLGLLAPTAGTIFVDDQDALAALTSWQGKFGYVAQSIYLLDGTVCDNVAFGERPEQVDREKVWRALQMAELADMVRTLPQGLDSQIGEGGVKLSGGQRQRLGIARALYRQPEILVLDEATSSLDNETEKAIMATLLKLRGKITIISVAHRLSTLTECDYKICFEKGRAQVEKPGRGNK